MNKKANAQIGFIVIALIIAFAIGFITIDSGKILFPWLNQHIACQ